MKETNPHTPSLEKLLETHSLAPTLEDQQRYLAILTEHFTEQLRQCGTYTRVVDSSGLELVSDVQFRRNVQFELFAEASMSSGQTGVGARTTILPISWRNDVGENRPVGRFTDDDLDILHGFFDRLDADKRAGFLPDLDHRYEINNPLTLQLGGQATKLALED